MTNFLHQNPHHISLRVKVYSESFRVSFVFTCIFDLDNQGSSNLCNNNNNNNYLQNKLNLNSTIYKMTLAYLLQSNIKSSEFSQLCEDSNRTIQREINSFSFNMIEPGDSRLTAYHRIITLVSQFSFESNIYYANI